MLLKDGKRADFRVEEASMLHKIDTVIVGGGQAGLAISYCLTQEGSQTCRAWNENQRQLNAWRNQRWDSFTLVTSNFQIRMPGAEYSGNDPYGFLSLAEVVEYFDNYVERFHLPVLCGVEVFSVERVGDRYAVRTSKKNYEAENVVIATGLYQSPKIPPFSAEVPPSVLQLHSMEYKNPSTLPEGAVLVVGTGQSGAQIAQELYQSGRKVYLSIGSAGRVPRRYRGKDMNDWFTRTGVFDTKVEELKSAADKFHPHPQVSGKNGGQSLNLHQFARDGVVLLGHVRGAHEGQLILAPDLNETLAAVDQFEIDALKKIDDYISRVRLAVPTENIPRLPVGYKPAEVVTELDLQRLGNFHCCGATGYAFDFSLVKLPIAWSDGYPIQKRGVTRYPGLYFLGLPWLYNRRSGILFGVGDDAAYLAAHIAARDSPRLLAYA